VPSARDPEVAYRIFGRRLRELRAERRVPQEELATLVGLTRSSIANIENGKQRVLLHQLLKFAEALRVDVAELLKQPLSTSAQPDIAAAKGAYLARLRTITGSQPSRVETSDEKKDSRHGP
jgi:transcriptional regulator with XRE-family HTH domain